MGKRGMSAAWMSKIRKMRKCHKGGHKKSHHIKKSHHRKGSKLNSKRLSKIENILSHSYKLK